MSAEASSSVRVAKDLTAGTVGGIAQVLVGQPFDIVKVFSLQLKRYVFKTSRFACNPLMLIARRFNAQHRF
ncbi:hypothetical protein BT69DRAFT_666038 [Atractiella rhizophila]|nr:hypothetical protein BT69DRAFT_666038 [Atractiella rhizophila]